MVRFRKQSIAIFEPVVAALFSHEIARRFVIPRNQISPQLWMEETQIMALLLLFLGIINISFATGSHQWRSARPIGWAVLLVAAVIRPICDTEYGCPLQSG